MRYAYTIAIIRTAILIFDGDPWDGRSKVPATYINGEKVCEAAGTYLPE
ncbi:MAG: hypothetical protein U9R47_10585 [Actinomycetota bacterium]|nr:hypothetical protein [Actinomycetota bacterium]